MIRGVVLLALMGTIALSSCAKKESAEQASQPNAEAPAAAPRQPQPLPDPMRSCT